MTRLDEYKGKCDNGEVLEGTSARTRPFSYSEIMLARKTKGFKSKRMENEPGVTDTPLAVVMAHSCGSPVTQPYVEMDSKHFTHGVLEGRSWRKRDSNALRKTEEFVQDKHVGTLGPDFKLKSVVERNFTSNMEHDVKIGRRRPNIFEKGSFLNNDYANKSGKKLSSHVISKGRVPERSEENFRMDGREHYNGEKVLLRKRKIDHKFFYSENDYRNRSARGVMHADKVAGQVIDDSMKERRQRHLNHVGGTRGRIAGKKHDSEVDLDRARGEESRTNRRRSLSIERVNERKRFSVLHSPRLPKHVIVDKGQQGELPVSSKDGLRKEHISSENKRMSSTGSGSQSMNNFSSSSGLGGYSPRKRKTDAGTKTPSPSRRSPEKRTAGWDLQPHEMQGTNNDSTVSNVDTAARNSTFNSSGLSSVTPMPPIPVMPINASALHMQNTESVQLTEATRPMRRLYVDNLPASAPEKDLMECVNQFLLSSGVNHIQGTQPCISCIRHKDKSQALLEFLTPEDASAALTLKGVSFLGSNLILRRPKDYPALTTAFPDKSTIAVESISCSVEDSPHKIFIGGISNHITSKMLLDIARAFGTVKAFHFEFNDEINEPCAFLEYADHSVTSKACAGLRGLRLGGKALVAVYSTPDAILGGNGKLPFYGIPDHAMPLMEKPTPILKLKNVLNPEHILSMPEHELEGVLEDIKLECSRFGVVNSINVVKPMHASATTKADDAENKSASSSARSTEHDTAESEDRNTSEPREDVCKSETVSRDVPARDFSCREMPCNLAGELENDNNSDIVGESVVELGDRTVASADGRKETDAITNGAVGLSRNRRKLGEASEGEDRSETDSSCIFEAGSVFVEFKRSESACIAAHGLHGRTFDGRVVSAGYVDHVLYQMRFQR